MSEAQSIYKRLRDVQVELHAPKDETGRFGKSRSAEKILEVAKPLCAKHGLTLVVSDDIELIGERHYVKATASVWDDAGSFISTTAHAWEGEVDRGLDTSQVTGKTSSYARKYALGGLFAIDDTKDADRDNEPHQAPAKASKPAVGTADSQGKERISPQQIRKIQIMFRALGYEEREQRLKYARWATGRDVTSTTDLTKREATKLIDHLSNDLEESQEEGAA